MKSYYDPFKRRPLIAGFERELELPEIYDQPIWQLRRKGILENKHWSKKLKLASFTARWHRFNFNSISFRLLEYG